MKIMKENWRLIRAFTRDARRYVRDVFLMHLLIAIVFIPALMGFAKFLLNMGGINYMSYDNMGEIFLHHPFVATGLIATLLMLLLTVFFEFAFLLQSVYYVQMEQPASVRQLIMGTLRSLKKIDKSSIFFFLFYFFLVIPLSGIKFNSELLGKFKIPVFILDVVFAHRFIIVSAVILVYIFLAYLSIRWVYVLPEMILNQRSVKEAVKYSMAETKRHFWKIFFKIIGVIGFFLLLTSFLYFVCFGAQALIEEVKPEIALPSAVIILTFLQLIWLFNGLFSTIGLFYIIVDDMNQQGLLNDEFNHEIKPKKKGFIHFIKASIVLVGIVVVFVLTSMANYVILNDPFDDQVLSLSHRGVDNENHVQNSLEALEMTNKDEKPDYVEMDVQETKDHDFVVYHDFNLRPLTGVNKKPYELNLDELTKLTVHENGMEAKIVSFDDYLAKANELNQKLLIEIKTTKNDSPEFMKRFTERYRESILKNGHIIQSLTYDTVEELKQLEPKFYVGYILPFSFVGPPSGAMDFYALEYTTLGQGFVDSAHSIGKEVYAWTPNDETVMTRMMFNEVDGIITDQMEVLNGVMESGKEMTYSDKLIFFMIGMG